ncbi:MAG TPA: DEAD/DEAH box helicase [Firmicutes bacterium]|jgi:SNF2 family DNA or RNA helicase|nr:DEAD/DEAH box helicase [Bacillota bacterium]
MEKRLAILCTEEEFSPKIHFFDDLALFEEEIANNAWDTWQAFALRLRAEELAQRQGGEELLVLTELKERWEQVGLIPYEHQIATVKRVINEMHGRAILADEVGLGKTIEAGMIIKEYILRGVVKKVLILTPASLCRQWAAELSQKFALYPVIARGPMDWKRYDLIVCSLDTAKKEENRRELQAIPFDLVVVDEAHKLKNPATLNHGLVSGLKKRFFLLLTATPFQNDLKELFNLISLLRPGQLGNYRAFRRRFMKDKRETQNTAELRSLLQEVMIRNRRGPRIQLPPRRVATLPLLPSPVEKEFYQAVTDFVRREYRRQQQAAVNPLTLLTLQREVCSSSFAAAGTLYKLCTKSGETDGTRIVTLLEKAAALKENAKMNLVEAILSQLEKEKVLIFTEFRATQQYIGSRLQRKGIPVLSFDGTMSASKKDFTIHRFRTDPRYPVLVCTEAGGEGINLQFCRTMINYDLPWNPMRLEQRIGRLHRLGQTREVYVYNLVTTGTIEEYLLQLLIEKVRLFDRVIGNSQRIIDYFTKSSFEARVMEALINTENDAELSERFTALGAEIEEELRRAQTDRPAGFALLDELSTGENELH